MKRGSILQRTYSEPDWSAYHRRNRRHDIFRAIAGALLLAGWILLLLFAFHPRGLTR